MKDTMTLIQGEEQLMAPTVGRYLNAPPVGTFLSPGSPAGSLKVLQRMFTLVVPADGGGIVKEVLVKGRAVPVEYGQPQDKGDAAGNNGGNGCAAEAHCRDGT